jgi:hypothetical protein
MARCVAAGRRAVLFAVLALLLFIILIFLVVLFPSAG